MATTLNIIKPKTDSMAMKFEKRTGLLIGAIVGVILGNQRSKNNETPPEDEWKYILGGAFTGYGLSWIFGSPNDTVNYTHYFKGKRVYEGIAYKDRFKKRMAEHKANGKLFTRVVKGNPKPRTEALQLEKERIKKYKPINNIQHNF